ncbi:hypothetical protein VTO73DRAFT_14733 [Trametes versicolor]
MAQYFASDARIDSLETGLLKDCLACSRWETERPADRAWFQRSQALQWRHWDPPLAILASIWLAYMDVPSVGAAILSAAHIAELIRSQIEALQSASESRDRVYTSLLIVALVPAVLFIMGAVRGGVLDPIATRHPGPPARPDGAAKALHGQDTLRSLGYSFAEQPGGQ